MIGRCVGNECYCTLLYQLAQSRAIGSCCTVRVRARIAHAQDLRHAGYNTAV